MLIHKYITRGVDPPIMLICFFHPPPPYLVSTLLDFVSSLQVVYVVRDDVLARGFRTYQHQDLNRRNTSGGQSANVFFYVVGHLAVRRMRSFTNQRWVVVLSAFHTQRPALDSITTALQKKGATGQDRARSALACFLC